MAREIPASTVLRLDDLNVLQPAPADGILPDHMEEVVSRRGRRTLVRGAHLTWVVLE